MAKRVVAFIPARSGSKRVKDKNVRQLAGHPLIAYSIQAAVQSCVFTDVICATDSEEYAAISRHYGAEVPVLRDKAISGDTSPDIEWVVWMLRYLEQQGRTYDAFSILRPTGPFRLPETIQRAWKMFSEDGKADSLRAVEKCKQHPGKMWAIRGSRMLPVMPFSQPDGTPWHSSQYTSLPDIYVQDASLEIAWTRIALEKGSIAGEAIIPFVSKDLEGFDINNPDDWWLAERIVASNEAKLTEISIPPYRV